MEPYNPIDEYFGMRPRLLRVYAIWLFSLEVLVYALGCFIAIPLVVENLR
jgi:hypothetical protein